MAVIAIVLTMVLMVALVAFPRRISGPEYRPRGPDAKLPPAGFELLFPLLRKLDEEPDDIIFFADEGGLWQVGVEWESVLPAYFRSLAALATPEEYARDATSAIRDFADQDQKRFLGAARRAATAAQRRALQGAAGPGST